MDWQTVASLVTSPRARARITQKGGDARHRSCKSEADCWETHRHIQKAQRATKTRRVEKEKQNKNKNKIANADRRKSNSAEGKATNIKKALKVSYASCRATYCSEERAVSELDMQSFLMKCYDRYGSTARPQDKRGTTRPHHKGGQRFGLRVESQATPIQPSLFEWAHSPCLRYTADDAQRNFNGQLCDLKSTCRYNRSCLNQVAK